MEGMERGNDSRGFLGECVSGIGRMRLQRISENLSAKRKGRLEWANETKRTKEDCKDRVDYEFISGISFPSGKRKADQIDQEVFFALFLSISFPLFLSVSFPVFFCFLPRIPLCLLPHESEGEWVG